MKKLLILALLPLLILGCATMDQRTKTEGTAGGAAIGAGIGALVGQLLGGDTEHFDRCQHRSGNRRCCRVFLC